MFQKNSFSIPSDSSGILLVKVIQTRKSNSLRHAKIGKFLRVVIRNTKKGKYYTFQDNALVLLKKRMNSRGKELYGPTSKLLKIKKFRIAYKCIF